MKTIDNIETHEVLEGISIIGFASDEGVIRNKGRPGAKEGPDTIRKAAAGLCLPDKLKTRSVQDLGNIECNDKNLERSQ